MSSQLARNSTPLRHDHQQHASGQQIEEEPQYAEILPAGISPFPPLRLPRGVGSSPLLLFARGGPLHSGPCICKYSLPYTAANIVTTAITTIKTAESASISMLAEANGTGHACRRVCEWPDRSTPSDGKRAVAPPNKVPPRRSSTSPSDFCRRPTQGGPRTNKSPRYQKPGHQGVTSEFVAGEGMFWSTVRLAARICSRGPRPAITSTKAGCRRANPSRDRR